MRRICYSVIVVFFGLLSFMHLSCEKSKSETEIKEEKIQQVIKEVKAAVKEGSGSTYTPGFFKEYDKECDSLYPNKKYKISIKGNFEKIDKNDHNSVFVFSQIKDGKTIEIFKDSIFIRYGGVEFKDFNNDNIEDILIQNDSDVRSNSTYNLYLVDLKKDKLKKIRGFNEIKNPHFLPKYNLIDNEVMSGRDWTSFYEIQGDTIKDFGYTLYWGEDENGNVNTKDDYKKTINKILKSRK